MVIGFENGISDLVVFETKIRSIRLPPKASADPGFQRLGTYVHKSQLQNKFQKNYRCSECGQFEEQKASWD